MTTIPSIASLTDAEKNRLIAERCGWYISKDHHQWGEDQGDKLPLKSSDILGLRSMADAARAELGDAAKGKTEVSMFAEIRGVPVKCRCDLLPDGLPAIIDFKSCASANPTDFARTIYDRGYHLQAALNVDIARACGLKVSEFWLLAIESKAPHATYIAELEDVPFSFIWMGRKYYRAAIQKLITAQQSNEWPGYGAHPAEAFAPVWILKELELTA